MVEALKVHADIARLGTHARTHVCILRFPTRALDSEDSRLLNGTFYDFRRRVISIEKVDRENPPAISRSLAARSYSDRSRH
jgi:hypothetical protein